LGDDFRYVDPVDGVVSEQQGVRVAFEGGARIVFRLSGTGTDAATLRIYMERYEGDPSRHNQDPQQALGELIVIASALAEVNAWTGKSEPDVIT
jgi:phosphoglucomutase